MRKMYSQVAVANRFVRSLVVPGDLCVDATVGNGHDTCLLADLVGKGGQVLGFDVQASALERAQVALASKHLADQVELLKRGHESLGHELSQRGESEVKLVMFNLGYLPGSDKSVITHSDSTLQALEQSLASLASNGAISIVAYRGHEGGDDEAQAVESWVQALPADAYFCFRYERWSNQRGLTPVFFWIRKRDNGIA